MMRLFDFPLELAGWAYQIAGVVLADLWNRVMPLPVVPKDWTL